MGQQILLAAGLVMILIATAGCEQPDERLAQFAEHAVEQQAWQNERMANQAESVARQSEKLATAAHLLVEQDATARRELFEAHDRVQSQLHVERTGLDQRRDKLEQEQHAFATAVVREPIVAEAIISAAVVLAALLPLIVTAYAISRLPGSASSDEREVADALLEFLNAPPGLEQTPSSLAAITDADQPRLPGPGPAQASADDLADL